MTLEFCLLVENYIILRLELLSCRISEMTLIWNFTILQPSIRKKELRQHTNGVDLTDTQPKGVISWGLTGKKRSMRKTEGNIQCSVLRWLGTRREHISTWRTGGSETALSSPTICTSNSHHTLTLSSDQAGQIPPTHLSVVKNAWVLGSLYTHCHFQKQGVLVTLQLSNWYLQTRKEIVKLKYH